MTDSLTVFGTDFTGVTGIKATGTGNGTLTYIRPQGTKSISANGTGIDVTEYASVDVAVPTGTPSLQSKTATPTTSQQTISPDSGYDGLSSVTVNAMPTGTAGTPTATKVVDATDASALITPSVTNTAGYISGGTKTGTPFYVTAGELVSGNTLTADDPGNWDVTELETLVIPEASQYVGIVSNEFFNDGNIRKWHVRGCADIDTTEGDSPGWVGEGAKYSDYLVYNAVPANTTITPSTLPKTIGGANYMMEGPVTVAAMPTGTAGTPTATKGSVSNHAISVTPSVTNATGYITGSTKTGTAVTVSASELVSGSETKTENGTFDVTNLAELVVNVSGSSVKTATGTFTGNGTREIDVACDFEPDIVYFTSDPGTTASSGTVAAIIVRDMMTATRYRNNSTTNSHYAIPGIANMNSSGSSYSWRATYANSKVTLYCYSNNARALLTSGRTYSYTFMKWT